MIPSDRYFSIFGDKHEYKTVRALALSCQFYYTNSKNMLVQIYLIFLLTIQGCVKQHVELIDVNAFLYKV